jgi:hypothetical protein
MRFKPSDHVKLALILCITIGLTPYYPVPHSYEKLKWLLEGGNNMLMLDYFDLIFSNLPWLYLLGSVIYFYRRRAKTKQETFL